MAKPPSSYQSLAEFAQSIESSPHPERELLGAIIERVRQRDPELAEAIRYCALPRRFDAELIGVLRGEREETEQNERLASGVQRLPFVQSCQDGCVYHETARSTLLEEWRAPDNRLKFQELNQRLVDFFKERHRHAERLAEDLGRTAHVIQNANPARFAQLAWVVERRLVAPLIEAIHHASLRSAVSGYELFREYFETFETRQYLTICESLLNAAREDLSRLPAGSGQEPWLCWLDYWRARLSAGLMRFAEAEGTLRELLPKTGDDAKLKLWTLGELGQVLQQQDKLAEAREAYQAAIALEDEKHLDPYNLPVWHAKIAHWHWTRNELDQAEVKYRDAIRAAQDKANPRLEAELGLSLAGVLQDRGEWRKALEAAIEALHLIRTRFRQDRALECEAARRLMSLLGARDPAMLDTAFAEVEAIASTLGSERQRLEARKSYTAILSRSGRRQQAREELERLNKEAGEHEEPGFATDLLLQTGSSYYDCGQMEEAIRYYSQVIDWFHEGRASRFEYLAAVANLGTAYSRLGRFDEAERDLKEAFAKCAEIGQERVQTYVRICLAENALRRGWLERAEELLSGAAEELGAALYEYVVHYHRVRGELERKRSRWNQARAQFRRALELSRGAAHLIGVVRSQTDLLDVACEEWNWAEAASLAADAQKCYAELAARDRYRRAPDVEEADQENVAGLAAYIAAPAGSEAMERARERLRAASATFPGNLCYRLNHVYACVALGDWVEAAEAVEAVLEPESEWARCQFLLERLADFRLQAASALRGAGQHAHAANLLAETWRRFADRLPDRSRLQIRLVWGDILLGTGQPGPAEAQYRDALAQAGVPAEVEASLQARLGLIAACAGQLVWAVEHFRASLEADRRIGRRANSLTDVLANFTGLPDTPAGYYTLGEAMRVMPPGEGRDEAIGGWLAVVLRCRRALFRPWEAQAGLESATVAPHLKPIVLEADDRLFQGVADPPQDRMINRLFPEMRERIQAATGVTIPGVLLRANAGGLGEGGYAILMHNVPVESGSVASAAEGQDRYEFLVERLEAALRQRLHAVFRTEELDSLVDVWARGSEERRAQGARALPDDRSRLRLLQVLRALLAEGLPLIELETILTAFTESEPRRPDVAETAEAVYAALKRPLGARQLVGLSSGFEAALARSVHECDGARFLALPPGLAQALTQAVRARIGQDGENFVLVVEQTGLRRFARRLVAPGWPALAVVVASDLPQGATLSGAPVPFSGLQ